MLSVVVLGGVAPVVAPSVLNLNGSVVYAAEENIVNLYYHFKGDDPKNVTRVKVNIAENPNATVGDYYPLSKDGGDLIHITNNKTLMWVYKKSDGLEVDDRGDLLSKYTSLAGEYTQPNNDGNTNAGANNNAGTEVKPNNDGNANAGANNNAGTEVKPNNDGNANAGANNNAGTNAGANNNAGTNAGANNNAGTNAGTNNNAGTNADTNNNAGTNAGTNNNAGTNAEPKKEEPTPTPAPKKEADEDAAIEALQNKVADLEKEVAELEKFITDNEDNSDAADYIAAAKDRLEAKKAELEKKEAELEESLKGLEPKAESLNGDEKAPVVDELPEFGANNPEIKKILKEMEEIVNKLESGDKDPKLLEKLADLREAFDILTQNKPVINEVPEYDLSKLPQPGVPTLGVPTPGVTDGNSFGQKTEAKDEAKEGSLPNTGMTTSSTAALGLSLIALVGLAVRRKLNN